MRATAREVFTVNGEIREFDGVKRFVPLSPEHTRAQLNKLPVGKKVSMTIAEWDTVRSPAQLAYHWVLMGYLADYTGFTKEEMHDAVMRLKFGETEVNIGNQSVMVRKSISDSGKMKKYDAVELVEYDLMLCAQNDIHVPTAKELGYISN